MKNTVIMMIFGVLTLSGCATISPQEVGLKVAKAGSERGIENTQVVNGYVLYNPFTTQIVQFPRNVQGVNWNSESGGEISFRSLGMRVTAPVAFNYRVDPEQAPTVFVKYGRDVDTILNRHLRQAVQDSMNRVGQQYSPEQLVGAQSVMFEDKVTDMLEKRFLQMGFVLESFSLPEGIHPPKSISDAITASNQAKQDAIRIQNELASTEAEAKKKIAEAEGQAKAQIAQAQGQAEAQKIKAKAEADSNRLVSSSLTPELIQYTKMQKWDGKNPNTILGSEANTMVTVK